MNEKEDIPVILYPPPGYEAQNDCDCACSLELTPALSAQNADGLWEINKNIEILDSKTLGWKSYFNPVGPVSLAVLNPAAERLLNSFFTPQPAAPKKEAVQALIWTGLIQPVTDYMDHRPSVESQILTAWLHLTDACNLRCDYCYLPHRPVSMSLETAQKTVDKLLESALQHGYLKLKIKYAGGEPLLRFDLLWDIHAYAVDAAAHSGVELEEILLTNGVLLTEEKIEAIKEMGMRLMISLDGVGGAHDAHRKYPNGLPTFSKVEQAIEKSQAAGLNPLISITISDRNLKSLPQTATYLLKKGLRFAFNFYRENDCSQGSSDLGFRDEEAIQYLAEAFAVIEGNLPSHSLLGSLADRASFVSPHQHTCGAGIDYLVVEPSGRIAKCQMDLAHPVTDIRARDPLSALRRDRAGLQNLPVHEKSECSTCRWQNYCGGGCPLATFRATGRYDARSPYCEIYKFLFPRLLELESRRLIFQAQKYILG